jgi:hypothetical protein
LEDVVASVDPAALREEILQLSKLIVQARLLEAREIESKLVKLKEVLTEHKVFDDPKMKLLLFTEHKDTLDYLVGKLREWRLTVTQIHGSMKIGDRDTPGTRIYAEREFREDCQVMVATEAAGEGINLQFCWFMINYDIPWNPVRLERRMGRIHRYGQEKDCLIFNFVTTNTREGRAIQKLFERIRKIEEDDLRRGAVFYDLHREDPTRLDVFSAAVKDGRGNVIHRHIFVIQTAISGSLSVRQPTLFLDLSPAPPGTTTPDGNSLPGRDQLEQALNEQALQPFLVAITSQREKEIDTISRHMEISLNELIHRQNLRMGELLESQQAGDTSPLLAANIKTTEDRLDELNGRLERRREELAQKRQCLISDIQHHGRAWVLPHPERKSPGMASMVRDEEIERIAVEAVKAYEEARGWQVESVEDQNRGFDLISRKPHPEDPQTAIEVRFIEVKGRAAVGEIALTTNEYKTAERLKNDYWLYVVFNCQSNSQIHLIQDPERLGWEPLIKVEHYHLGADKILTPGL